jgi:hypothetical protein
MNISLVLFTLTAVLAVPIPHLSRLHKRGEEEQVLIQDWTEEHMELLKGIRFF